MSRRQPLAGSGCGLALHEVADSFRWHRFAEIQPEVGQSDMKRASPDRLARFFVLPNVGRRI